MFSKKDYNRKRNKKFFYNKDKKKSKLEEFEPGLKGFLITCNDKKEAPAVSEAYSLLNEYADKLYGPEATESSETIVGDEDNIERSLENEISELKDKKVQRRFKSVKTKGKNILFIKTILENPNELCDTVLSDLKVSKLRKTRYCIKLMPVLLSCKASVKSIQSHAKSLFEDFFQSNNNQATYCIIFKSRCNDTVKRDDVIPDMSTMIHSLNEKWTVKYKQPDYTVFVNIIATVCTLSILKDFDGLCKYNLQSLTDLEEKICTKETDDDKRKCDIPKMSHMGEMGEGSTSMELRRQEMNAEVEGGLDREEEILDDTKSKTEIDDSKKSKIEVDEEKNRKNEVK